MAKSEFPSLHLQYWVEPFPRERERQREMEGGGKKERERASGVTKAMVK